MIIQITDLRTPRELYALGGPYLPGKKTASTVTHAMLDSLSLPISRSKTSIFFSHLQRLPQSATQQAAPDAQEPRHKRYKQATPSLLRAVQSKRAAAELVRHESAVMELRRADPETARRMRDDAQVQRPVRIAEMYRNEEVAGRVEALFQRHLGACDRRRAGGLGTAARHEGHHLGAGTI